MRIRILALFTLGLWACSPLQDFNRAKQLSQERKFYNAIEYYLTFVHQHPDHPKATEALLEVGNIQAMMGELDKAIETYRKLVDSYPINTFTVQGQRRIADIYKNNFSNYRQALTEYDKLMRAVPKHHDAPQVQFEVADCYTLLHQYEQADIEYLRLLERYPSFEKIDEVYIKKANNAYIWGRYDKAIEDYNHALQHDSDAKFRTDTVFGIASSYDELDDFDQASNFYKQVLETYPSRKVIEIRLKGLEDRRKKKTIKQQDTKL